jgi:hypothetical protein
VKSLDKLVGVWQDRDMNISRTFITLVLAGGAISGLTSCQTDATQVPENVIVIPEDYDAPFNAEPGDTLILVMYQDDNGVPSDWQGRCFHMGGEPILNLRTNIATCEGVDF